MGPVAALGSPILWSLKVTPLASTNPRTLKTVMLYAESTLPQLGQLHGYIMAAHFSSKTEGTDTTKTLYRGINAGKFARYVPGKWIGLSGDSKFETLRLG